MYLFIIFHNYISQISIFLFHPLFIKIYEHYFLKKFFWTFLKAFQNYFKLNQILTS